MTEGRTQSHPPYSFSEERATLRNLSNQGLAKIRTTAAAAICSRAAAGAAGKSPWCFSLFTKFSKLYDSFAFLWRSCRHTVTDHHQSHVRQAFSVDHPTYTEHAYAEL